jgi:chitin disaccharide deacetylase
VLIVLNADDFGVSEETVRATIECFEQGALTSATIMPGMPATGEAVRFARMHPEFSFGVHLTLVGDGDAEPLAGKEAVPGLVRANGALLPTNHARLRAILHRLPLDQLEREIAAQIDAVRSAGVKISHVDSHRHLHKLGAVRKALARVLPRFGIVRVRNVQDIYLSRPLGSPTYWLGPLWRRRVMSVASTTTHFYMPTGLADANWDLRLLDRLATLSGSLEVGVHPGTDEEWRAAERAAVVSFAAGARERGHRLATWREVTALG